MPAVNRDMNKDGDFLVDYEEKVFEDVKQQGFTRVRVDGVFCNVDDDIEMERYVKHDIDVVVDRVVVKAGARHAGLPERVPHAG